MTPGASLDAAISGLTARVDSARKTATGLSGVTENGSASSNSAPDKTSAEDGKGSFVDVTA